MNNKTSLLALGAIASAALLAGCGGDSDTSTTTPTTETPSTSTSQFTQSGEWVFTLPASGSSICYDLDTKATVDCTTTATWDLKVKSSGLTGTLWTNSGVSGTGKGGAFGGPFDHTWTALKTWLNGTTDPDGGALPSTVFLADSAASVFTGSNAIQSAAFEYAVTGASGDHSLYPNFRVFLVTTNSAVATAVGTTAAPVYALQVIGYYGSAAAGSTPVSSVGSTSGIVTFRYTDRSLTNVQTATVDARNGWVYYDLKTNTVSSATGDWQIAFNRYTFKLNGGESGSGTVAGFVGKTPAGFYAADGTTPVVAKFSATTNVADTLADLTASDIAAPAAARNWVKDSTASPLNPAYTGAYPAPLDYGWYSYYADATAAANAGLAGIHMIKANPDRSALIRTGEGTGYARFHLNSIVYATATPAYNGAQTWTIQYDLQPSTK